MGRVTAAALAIVLCAIPTPASGPRGDVAILVYHRFGSAVHDSMTIRRSTFEWQLRYLTEHHYPVIPLRSLIAYRRGTGPAPPPSAVVMTIDDGHASVMTDMLPVLQKFNLPVTLFVYPSAIGNAPYALTWHQLEVLRDTGLVDIQSHTYWHPNFTTEKKRLTPEAYREFAASQLRRSKTVLRERLGVDTRLLAWPFGIHDAELSQLAQDCGYDAALALGNRLVNEADPIMALPRFLVTDAAQGPHFVAMLPPVR